MAKKRKRAPARTKATEEEVSFLDRQSAKLVAGAVEKLESLASKATKAVTAGSRKKYVLGALAALIVAGRAAQVIHARLGRSGSRRKRQ